MTTPNKCSSCDNIATIQISHCNTKNGGLEKGEHFNYYCDSHYRDDTKNIPYPCFVTDLGEQHD